MTFRFILGFLIGVALGAGIALALAPQPGAETRHQLIDKMRERTRPSDGGE
jgi:gas vesicle protein